MMRVHASGWLSALLLLALLLPVSPAAAQRPDAVTGGVAEAEAECRTAGGRPSLRGGFETELDLNGDGRPDYLHDFEALDCAGAASFFCGSAGCPLIAYVSAGNGYRSMGLGHVQAWSVDRSGAIPVLVLSTHGGACGRAGAADCERRVAWNGREFAAAGRARPPAAPPTAPSRPASPGDAKAGTAPASLPAPGAWQVRTGADGRPIAMVAGPGVVRVMTVLCHEGVPVAVLGLRARPPAGPVTLGIAGRAVRASAPLSPSGGDTWAADLRNSLIPRLLTGGNASVELLINGGMQGRLTLQGSARAIREALAGCLAL